MNDGEREIVHGEGGVDVPVDRDSVVEDRERSCAGTEKAKSCGEAEQERVEESASFDGFNRENKFGCRSSSFEPAREQKRPNRSQGPFRSNKNNNEKRDHNMKWGSEQVR